MLWHSRYVTVLQRVWTSHVQVLRGRVRRDLKTMKRYGKSWANGMRIAGAARPDRYSDGTFRVEIATMRRVHRAAQRIMSCQAFAPRCWTQTIRGEEDHVTCECKVAIETTFRAHWWRIRKWQWMISQCLATPRSKIVYWQVIITIEPRQFLEDAGNVTLERMRDAIERHDSANKNIITKNSEIYRCIDIHERHIVEPILAFLEEFQWQRERYRIFNLIVNMNKLNPLQAGCHFEVPREIIFKKAMINVYSMDNACLVW